MTNSTSNQADVQTPGAIKAGNGAYVFEMASVNQIMGGPDYSTAEGSCVEGDRIIVALMRMKAGTGAVPHSHPNEQWIYVLEGTFEAMIEGKQHFVKPGSAVYIPANAEHYGRATADADVVFFTCKDASYGLQGIKS